MVKGLILVVALEALDLTHQLKVLISLFWAGGGGAVVDAVVEASNGLEAGDQLEGFPGEGRVALL